MLAFQHMMYPSTVSSAVIWHAAVP
jgi:hypothetical protein